MGLDLTQERHARCPVLRDGGLKMKKITQKKAISTLVLLVGVVFILGGCAEDEVYVVRSDYTPPSVPKGLCSTTMHKAVYLEWYENDEEDFKEYRVYRRDEGDDYYHRIAVTRVSSYTDRGLDNGYTYFYTVTAVDRHGNESGFSDVAWDTPRPEGSGLVIHDYQHFPKTSGYDFSRFTVVGYNEKGADVYVDYDDYYGVFFLCATDTLTDIQDFGYTNSLDDVNVAPEEGWSAVGWVEVIFGHSYIVWTRDNHFAKLRVTGFTYSYGVVFDWAYQEDSGNTELAPRPPHSENYLRPRPTHSEDDQR
jgi:hypothetical protein